MPNPTPPTDLSRLLAEVERLDKKATKGPWNHCSIVGGWDGISDEAGMGIARLIFNEPANADFIAFARTALPQLAAIVAQLQRERDEWKRKANKVEDGKCAICGKLTNALSAGNPDLWPLIFPKPGESVKSFWHVGCVAKELTELTTLRAQLSAAQQRVEELEGQLSNRITS